MKEGEFLQAVKWFAAVLVWIAVLAFVAAMVIGTGNDYWGWFLCVLYFVWKEEK